MVVSGQSRSEAPILTFTAVNTACQGSSTPRRLAPAPLDMTCGGCGAKARGWGTGTGRSAPDQRAIPKGTACIMHYGSLISMMTASAPGRSTLSVLAGGALFRVLRWLRSYARPLRGTENGAATVTRGKVVARIANPKFDVVASQYHTLRSAHTGGGGLSAGDHAGVWVMRPGASLGGGMPASLPPVCPPLSARHRQKRPLAGAGPGTDQGPAVLFRPARPHDPGGARGLPPCTGPAACRAVRGRLEAPRARLSDGAEEADSAKQSYSYPAQRLRVPVLPFFRGAGRCAPGIVPRCVSCAARANSHGTPFVLAREGRGDYQTRHNMHK